MSGITDLDILLESISPVMQKGDYVFCIVPEVYSDIAPLAPLAFFKESEGNTLILTLEEAEKSKLPYESVFKQITLTVHSSLEAVGLTAAVSSKLASRGISANVVAAYFHDHIFVPKEKAEEAMRALKELTA